MNIKNLNKKIITLVLSSTFVLGSSPYLLSSIGYADTAIESEMGALKLKKKDKDKDKDKEEEKEPAPATIEYSAVYESLKEISMPDADESKPGEGNLDTLTINVKTGLRGKGYVTAYFEDDILKINKTKKPDSKEKFEPMILKCISGGQTYYSELINNFAMYTNDKEDKLDGFVMPCEEMSDVTLELIDPNVKDNDGKAAYTKKFEFKVRANDFEDEDQKEIFANPDVELLGTPEDPNRKLYAFDRSESDEDEYIYKGFPFNRTGERDYEEDLFLRPVTNADQLTIKIGGGKDFKYDAPRDKGYQEKYIVEYYNSKETYDKIGKWSTDKKEDYDKENGKDKYKRKEVRVGRDNSVTIPWNKYDGILRIRMSSPNNYLFNILVKNSSDAIDVSGGGGNSKPDPKPERPDPKPQPKPDTTIKADVHRFYGDNRYDTAIKLSKEGFNKSDEAVIASGKNFADALSGGALAGVAKLPLLLVDNRSVEDVQRELRRLGVSRVYLLGGENSVSFDIQKDIENSYDRKDQPIEVRRLAGKNRYETSLEVYKQTTRYPGSIDDPILVNGKGFADALAAGPLAADTKRGIILTDGHNVGGNIDKNDPNNIIIGGLNSMDSTFKGSRFAGKNRYETAAKIAKHFGSPKNVMLASGTSYADGLSAISLFQEYEAPLLLTEKDKLPEASRNILKKSSVEDVYIIGGVNSVSNSVKNIFK